MYSPHPFRIDDFSVISSFISENPLATIISNGEKFPMASHIPLYIEERVGDHYLIGHASRANEQMRKLENSNFVTVTFQGPHGYISAYAKDPDGMSILPTWDYQIVEIRGELSFVSETRLKEILIKLMKRHERDEPKQINLDDYPADVLQKKMKAITGFEIKISEVVGCFRLNQNRTAQERGNIVDRLSENPASHDLVKGIKKFSD